MSRRLALLNLLLLALAAGAAWQLRVRWAQGNAQEGKLLGTPPGRAPAGIPAPAPPPQPATAASYSEVAQKVLLSRDRNPDVILEAEPPKPVPPMPVLYGVLDLGGGPTLILSEKEGGLNRSYRLGEKVGDFTLLALEGDELVLGWDGQEFRKRLAELKPKPGAAAPQTAAAPAAPAGAPSVVVETAAAVADKGPGPQVAANMRACVAGDTSPAGTVKDGYRKVISQTPFGSNCRWEPVK
ncbi:MAG: hypothetical protein IT159_15600 [Bryobacterales bacterium]|nr:hypothetical protein [Bryobacterales bacterium]